VFECRLTERATRKWLEEAFFTEMVCKATKISKIFEFLFIAENCGIISQGLDLSGERRDLNFIFFKERIGKMHNLCILCLYLLKYFRNILPKMQILRSER